MKRLSFKWCNRLVVLLCVLAPLLWIACVLFAYLGGCEGTIDFSDFVNSYLDNYLYNSPLGVLGFQVIEENVGFEPLNIFIRYIDQNLIPMVSANGTLGYVFWGYFAWCFYVLLADLAFYIVSFFIRIVKMLTDKIEGVTDL